MTYSLNRLSGEVVVIAELKGKLDPETLMQMYTESSEIIRNIDHSCCLILDFTKADVPHSGAAELLEVIGSGMSVFSQRIMPVFFAFVSEVEIVQQFASALEPHGIRVPVFRTVKEAQSYLNLKIDSLNLKESLNSLQTQDIDQTYRYAMELLENVYELSPIERGTSAFPKSGILRLQGIDLDRSILLFPDKDLLLGRRDSEGEKPDADFSLWGGYQSGISRQHAKIALNDKNELEVFDLGSTNGTFLNGLKLQPNRAYVLHDGDELRLGKLNTRLYYQRAVKGTDEEA